MTASEQSGRDVHAPSSSQAAMKAGRAPVSDAVFWLWMVVLYLAILYFSLRTGSAHPTPPTPADGMAA